MCRRHPDEEVAPSFLRNVVVVPSGGPVAERFEGFVPVLYDRAGVPMLAVFSSLARARAVSDVAKRAMTMPGRELVAMMPESYGVVVNPGSAVGFELPPEGVAKVKQFLLEEAE